MPESGSAESVGRVCSSRQCFPCGGRRCRMVSAAIRADYVTLSVSALNAVLFRSGPWHRQINRALEWLHSPEIKHRTVTVVCEVRDGVCARCVLAWTLRPHFGRRCKLSCNRIVRCELACTKCTRPSEQTMRFACTRTSLRTRSKLKRRRH